MPDIPLNILGYGYVTSGTGTQNPTGPTAANTAFDVLPYLRDRKSIKLMAKQDQMAVCAAAMASVMAGVDMSVNGERTGIYFSVGHIPFEQHPLDVLYEKSIDKEKLSMARFATEALSALNPLMTFKCLPNMPVYHVSYNLQIEGPYFVTYPGAGQWVQALQQAITDIANGRVRYALVGAVADQLNPLVRHHINRTDPDATASLIDAACVFLLSGETSDKTLGVLSGVSSSYQPHDAFKLHVDNPMQRAIPEVQAGAADPALYIARQLDRSIPGQYPIALQTGDGMSCRLLLEVL